MDCDLWLHPLRAWCSTLQCVSRCRHPQIKVGENIQICLVCDKIFYYTLWFNTNSTYIHKKKINNDFIGEWCSTGQNSRWLYNASSSDLDILRSTLLQIRLHRLTWGSHSEAHDNVTKLPQAFRHTSDYKNKMKSWYFHKHRQRQSAVTAYISNKQLLPSAFALQSRSIQKRNWTLGSVVTLIQVDKVECSGGLH